MDKSRHAYQQHRHGAKRRGIDFNFTYVEWCRWWRAHLGPNWMKRRGKRKGLYVMSRFRDVGPYTASNVRCVECGYNISERHWGYALPLLRVSHLDEEVRSSDEVDEEVS